MVAKLRQVDEQVAENHAGEKADDGAFPTLALGIQRAASIASAHDDGEIAGIVRSRFAVDAFPPFDDDPAPEGVCAATTAGHEGGAS